MTDRTIGTREEWLAAREALLVREKEHTRLGDELARQRPEAFRGCFSETEYRFDTEEGTRTLAELFNGRSQLVVYHLEIWAGLHGGLSDLFGDGRQLQRRASAPRGRRRDDDLHFTRPAREVARLPSTHGLELQLGVERMRATSTSTSVSLLRRMGRTRRRRCCRRTRSRRVRCCATRPSAAACRRSPSTTPMQPVPTRSATSPRDTASAASRAKATASTTATPAMPAAASS